MQWPGYTSFVVGAVLLIFVSIPCLFHYVCCWSEFCLGCLIYISCLFLAFYSLFSCFKNKKTNKQTKTNQMILLIVFIHQLLCIENTKEQLPDMNFCHPLQEKISSFRGGCRPHTPCLQVLFFWLRQWVLVFIWYILNVYGSTTNLWSLYHSPDTCEADKIWYFSIYMYCLWKC